MVTRDAAVAESRVTMHQQLMVATRSVAWEEEFRGYPFSKNVLWTRGRALRTAAKFNITFP